MTDTSQNNKSIAKNTILLYLRMVIMTIVNMYTSRVVLNALGVEDFGTYNVVGGFVVLFTFLNGPLSTATQRFMSYEIGLGNNKNITSIFSISLILYLIISVLILLCGETLGLWFLNNKMSFPQGRSCAVIIIYQLSVLTVLFQIVRIPFNSAIIAYERMQFFAYVSLLEAFLQLSIAILIRSINTDRLILYGSLIAVINFIITLAYYYYCRCQFHTIRFHISKDRQMWLKLTGFSGWSIFGSCANVAALQGINLILNIFGGVAVNAGVGIANQASSAIYKMVSSFQMAFNPQIVKQYAQKDYYRLFMLVMNSSKYSFFLLYIIAFPAILCLDRLLEFWLGNVPDYSVGFCVFMLLFLLVDAISAPFWMLVQATGNIKKYQIIVSTIIMLNIPVSLVMMWVGIDFIWVFVIKAIINLCCHIFRVFYLRKNMQFPCRQYAINSLVPLLSTIILSLPIPLYLHISETNVFITTASSIVITFAAILLVGLSKKERNMIVKKIRVFKI